MKLRLSVDHAVCQGHGLCYLAADELFAIRESDGRAIVLVEAIPAHLEALARRAEAGCPERAIRLAED